MAFFLYASFPNSRNKPRPATSAAITYQSTIADYTQPLTRVATATSNRTYILLENLSLITAFWYTYAATLDTNPSATPRFGVPKDKVYNPVSNILYEKQDTGITTNWIPVSIEVVGEQVSPLQIASLESPQDIYAAADSAAPVVPPVIVAVDQGTG